MFGSNFTDYVHQKKYEQLVSGMRICVCIAQQRDFLGALFLDLLTSENQNIVARRYLLHRLTNENEPLSQNEGKTFLG